MEKIRKWLTTKPYTKAVWIAAFVGVLTLIAVIAQAYIYYRQAKIMERQVNIAANQSKLIQNQLQLSTRPYIEIDMITATGETGASTLNIQNMGTFSVRNVKINVLYFAKIKNHGWWVTAPGGGL